MDGGQQPPPTKTVLFSMFGKALDLVATRLAGVPLLRLDGSLSLVQRAEVIKQFRDDPQVGFLLSR